MGRRRLRSSRAMLKVSRIVSLQDTADTLATVGSDWRVVAVVGEWLARMKGSAETSAECARFAVQSLRERQRDLSENFVSRELQLEMHENRTPESLAHPPLTSPRSSATYRTPLAQDV